MSERHRSVTIRNLLWIATCFGVILLISSGLQLRYAEPVYEGKPLGEWLRIYNSNSLIIRRQDQLDEFLGGADINELKPPHLEIVVSSREHLKAAANVIKAAGEEILPYLEEYIAFDPSWIERFAESIAEQLHMSRQPIFTHPYERADAAVCGYEILGSRATSSIPKLYIMAVESRNPRSALLATSALARIGTNALYMLSALFTNQQAMVLMNVCGEAYHLDTSAAPMVPHIIKCLSNSDRRVREAAIRALGKMAIEAEAAVPALTNCLSDSDNHLRVRALYAIGRFGDSAYRVRPLIVKMTNDPDEVVRNSALKVLSKISPSPPHE